ncbi:MAG: transposase, partial [Woeseia sp.]
MSQTATIRNLPQAFEFIKEMELDGYGWGEDCRSAGREVVARILEERIAEAVDHHLEEIVRHGAADRTNGHYRRHLLTELGHITRCIPRTRRFDPLSVVRAYGRRAAHIDRMFL